MKEICNLIVKEEGKIYYKRGNEEPVVCEDQDKAMNILWKIQTGGYVDPREFKPAIGSIYPVPGIEFEYITPDHPDCEDGKKCTMFCHSICEKLEESDIKTVARLIEHTAEK